MLSKLALFLGKFATCARAPHSRLKRAQRRIRRPAELSRRVAASLECLEDRLLLSGTSVIVSPAAVPPPVASAGANQTVNVNATVPLSGTVTYTTQPGATLSTVWQVANGPGTVTFANSATPQTTATFSAAGTYYLRLVATYAGVSDQSYTTITVNPVAQPASVSLQDGTNGYSGMNDTYITDVKGDDVDNYSTSTTLNVAGRQRNEQDALLLWNLSSVSSGTITSASITVDVTTSSSSSTATYNLYALATPWNESQVTFDQASNGTSWEVAGAERVPGLQLDRLGNAGSDRVRIVDDHAEFGGNCRASRVAQQSVVELRLHPQGPCQHRLGHHHHRLEQSHNRRRRADADD